MNGDPKAVNDFGEGDADLGRVAAMSSDRRTSS